MRQPKLLASVVLLCSFYPALGQSNNYIYATGVPSFSSTLPIDHGIVNVNNGDIHLEIPLATHTQRGSLALEEKLVYDSRIWKIVQSGSGYSWQPSNVPNSWGGWIFSSGSGAGTITYGGWGGSAPCPDYLTLKRNYSQHANWQWADPRGTVHYFPGAYTIEYSQGGPANCQIVPTGQPTGGGYASDGSGYYLSITNYTTATVIDPRGTVYHPTTTTPGAVQVVDSNGNYWTSDSNGNLVDSRGLTPVLKTTSGNNIYFDVLGVGGARQRYTVTLTSVSFHTAFGQSAVTDVSGSFNAIQSIELPDGSSYQFAYDTSGYGELTSMTLPTGGVITYSYANYLDSFSNDNRWLSSIARDGGSTTFTPSVISQCSSSSGCQEKVKVTSPDANDTVYTFNLDPSNLAAGGSWVQNITAYQGSSTSGAALVSQSTQYTYSSYPVIIVVNGNQNTAPYNYSVPASFTTTTTLKDVNLTTQTVTTLDTTGSKPTEVKLWDYYAGSAPSTPTTDTTYSYYYAFSSPASVIVKDGSGNPVNETTYGHDEGSVSPSNISTGHTSAPGLYRNNTTSQHQWINASGTTLDSSATFDDAGTVLTSTDPNGKITYGHDNTDAFTTSATPPTPSSGIALTWSTSYDASTGVVTSTTDANGQPTTYSNFDQLNRSQLITYPQPDGGHDYFTYNPTQLIAQHDIDGGSSRVQRYTQYDAYGRISRVADENGQSSYDWYQTDYCYDVSGRLSFQPVRYQGGGWASAKRCSGAGDTTTYDALGRITKVSHADGSYAQYSYRGRATQVTDENGVSRIMQSDALGRLTTVCEISASGMGVPVDNPVPCTNSAGVALDIAGTGFLTQYSYNLANHTSTITQGLQTRAIQTDWLGRLISLQQPEVGGAAEPTTFSYSYNSTGLQVVRKRLKANSGSPTALTTTTTQYDELGRMLSIAYDDGTPTREYSYDDANYLNAPQVHRTNVKGRPSTAMTYVPNTSNMITGVQYSYDVAGRVTSMWECGAPATCGNGALARELTFSYDYAGRQTGVSDPIAGNIVYGLTTAGEITAITNTTYNNSTNPGALVSTVQNGPYGPASYHLGNGLTNVMTYDSSGRSEFRWLCAGGVTATFCTGGTQLYGTYTQWKGGYLTHGIDTTENSGGDYTYDALGRLTAYTGTQGQPTSYSWAYDRYGNRYGATPGANITINKGNNIIQTAGFFNDAAGNETNDSVHSYTFDAENNVISVDGGSTATYTYNALNQRMGVSNAQGAHEFTYDFAGRRMGTWTPGTNSGTQGQIWWGGSPIAYRDNDGSTYFQQADWVGTQRILTNYAGSVSSQYTSRPWGDAYATTGKDDNLFHYAGLEQSENTGTLHAQFRDVDSSLGRWLSPDSYAGSYDFTNPQSFNRFSYAGNRPNSMTDPFGLLANGAYCGDSCDNGGGDGFIGIFVDIGEAIASLFGGGRPSFHGSLTPRPSDPLDDHLGLGNYKLPNPGIAGALGLPDAGCEFGACGSVSTFAQGVAGALDFCSQHPTICTLGADAAALARAIPAAAATVLLLNMQGDNKRVDDATLAACNARYFAEQDRCRARFGKGGRFGSNREVGACLDRAFYRYQACVRGQSDPAGPMAKSQEVPKDESSMSFMSLATTPIKWETAGEGAQ